VKHTVAAVREPMMAAAMPALETGSKVVARTAEKG